MTAPRIPLFQRKGAPSAAGKPAIAIHIGPASDAQTSNSDSAGPGQGGNGDAEDASDQAKEVTCPNCGCEFNPQTGEITDKGDYGKQGDVGGGALPPGLAAALGSGGPPAAGG